jgi:hypothetical protein
MAARKVVVEIAGDSSKYSKATDQAIKASEGFADRMKKIGLDVRKGFVEGIGIGGGISVFDTVTKVVSGAVDKVGESITLASNKAEAASKANVLFGDSYGIVEKASRSAASTVAMSSGKYLEAAGDVGNLVLNMGVAGDEAAKMSVRMLQLAADMGSFNNASPEDVVEAIGAAFRGETEPIRQYGVMLSAAKVEQQALTMGLKNGKQPLTDYAKAMATYSLILDQTAAAQGDLARTADGLSNKQRLAAARQEEAYTRLGEAIQPLATEIMPALADATTAVVGGLTDVLGAIKGLASVVRDVDEFFKPWEKEARLAREEASRWADALEEMPKAAGMSRRALEGIATAAQEAGTGLAGAKEELIDLARWNEAIANSGSQLPGMVRNFERWMEWLDKGTITVDQFDAKVRAMVRAGLTELQENLDILPPQLAAVVRSLTEGAAAVEGTADRMDVLPRAIDRAMTKSLRTMATALDPWKTAWSELAAWAKDPFRPDRMENWIENKVEAAIRKANRAAKNGEPEVERRWRRVARLMQDPVFKALVNIGVGVEEALADIALVKAAGRSLADVAASVFDVFGNDGDGGGGGGGGGGNRGGSAHEPSTGHNASGTPYWRGGRTWVGEAGPEIIDLPTGSRVWSHPESMRMMGGGGTTNHYHLSVNVPPTANLADVGREITRALKAFGQGGGQASMRAAIGVR